MRRWLVVLAVLFSVAFPGAAFAHVEIPDVGLGISSEPTSCVDDHERRALCADVDEGLWPAALCNEDGTSAVAPHPVVPISGDRIEGARRCSAVVASLLPGSGVERERAPGTHHPDPVEPADLPELSVPAPTVLEVILVDRFAGLDRADAHPRRLDRPPMHG